MELTMTTSIKERLTTTAIFLVIGSTNALGLLFIYANGGF